jgi:hypothetical protein
MYAGVIGSAVTLSFRRGVAIATVHARFNLTNKGEKNAGRYIYPRLDDGTAHYFINACFPGPVIRNLDPTWFLTDLT